MSDSGETKLLPEWVRHSDGSQVPFDADRICQSLFAASESLGNGNAFLARELTDAVLHFLAQESLAPIATTVQIAEQVEKIVREVGHPQLAHRYIELRGATVGEATTELLASVPMHAGDTPADLVRRSLEVYSLNVVFSRDLRAAVREGLLHLSGITEPGTLTSFVLDSRTLGEEEWWLYWDQWKASGSQWIVDSPEWLSIHLADRLPIVRLCERIVSLPRVANHVVELHLNLAEPPVWIDAQGTGPLFAGVDNPFSLSHRFGFLDMLLEQCLRARPDHAPALAWHLHEECFTDPAQLGRLKMLLRHAVQGKGIRFVFDRPGRPLVLSEGMDRQCPGVLLEVGLDLPAFARRPDIAHDGVALLSKLPSLARMAVSAAAQKRQHLRNLPVPAVPTRGFLIERSAASVVPLGLDTLVRTVTGQGVTKSPLSLDFALQILRTLQGALRQAGEPINLDLRLESPSHVFATNSRTSRRGAAPAGVARPTRILPLSLLNSLTAADASVPLRQQLEIAGRLHACAGSGTATLLIADPADVKIDGLLQLLHWAWEETAVARLELRRADRTVQQGELAI
jgi:hypothetical protein